MSNAVGSIKKDEAITKGIIHAILIAGALSMIAPFAWMIITSFKTPQEAIDSSIILPHTKFEQAKEAYRKVKLEGKGGAVQAYLKVLFDNYFRAWNGRKVNFTTCFKNSFFIAVVCTIGQLITCALAAFAFSHMVFPGKDAIFVIMLASMMCPPQVLLIPNFMLLMKLGWLNTYYALIVPFIGSFFGIFLLRQFFMTMPRDLWDAARIDGCSRFTFLWKILIPLSWAPLTTIAVFTFVGNWNSFFWPLIVTFDKSLYTIQVGLSYYNSSEGTQWELLMAASFLAILPLLIGFFFAQKQFIQGMAHTGSKE
jgi:multiple sugar transport system permease protein